MTEETKQTTLATALALVVTVAGLMFGFWFGGSVVEAHERRMGPVDAGVMGGAPAKVEHACLREPCWHARADGSVWLVL